MERAKVLAVEDDEHARGLLKELLSGLGHEVEVASDGLQALERAASFRPDVILLDVMMPKLDGFGVLQKLRAEPPTALTPVILLTALSDLDAKMKGIALGADDYLTKPFKLFELQARLSSALAQVTYRRQIAALEEQLRETSGTDPVTGAGSYGALRRHLEYEVSRARRYSRPLSTVLVSVDGLHALRRSDGEAAVDAALGGVAGVLRRQLREADRMFRIDRDELLLVLPETDEVGAALCARRISERVAEARHLTPAREIQVTVTCGTSTFPGADVLAPDDLVRRAGDDLAASRETDEAG